MYDDNSTDKTSAYTITNGTIGTATISGYNCVQFNAPNGGAAIQFANVTNFEVSYDYYPTNTWEWHWIRLDGSTNRAVLSSSSDAGSSSGCVKAKNLGYNKWINNVRIIVQNNVLTVYIGGVNKGSVNLTETIPYTSGLYWNRKTYIKNLKVKAL